MCFQVSGNLPTTAAQALCCMKDMTHHLLCLAGSQVLAGCRSYGRGCYLAELCLKYITCLTSDGSVVSCCIAASSHSPSFPPGWRCMQALQLPSEWCGCSMVIWMCSQLLLFALCMMTSVCNIPTCVLSCMLMEFASQFCCTRRYMLTNSFAHLAS